MIESIYESGYPALLVGSMKIIIVYKIREELLWWNNKNIEFEQNTKNMQRQQEQSILDARYQNKIL